MSVPRETKVKRNGRPRSLSGKEAWSLYVCRLMGASIEMLCRGFNVSAPTAKRTVRKFRTCDQRMKAAAGKYQSECDVLFPGLRNRARQEPTGWLARRCWLLSRAKPAWADRREIHALYAEARRLTRQTGVRHQVDHVIPIKGRLVCGLHVHTNMQVITQAENIAKSNAWEESYEQ